MNNVKVVHTKQIKMTSNNFTEAVIQKQSNRKMPQKYGAHPQKNTHAGVKIPRKSGGNNTETTVLHRHSPWNPRIPLEHPSPLPQLTGEPWGKYF